MDEPLLRSPREEQDASRHLCRHISANASVVLRRSFPQTAEEAERPILGARWGEASSSIGYFRQTVSLAGERNPPCRWGRRGSQGQRCRRLHHIGWGCTSP